MYTGIFGTADVDVTLDASSNTWEATTAFLNLGTVATGTVFFTRRDTDGDGVPDDMDNCILAFNPSQYDSNGDGYGNFCDPDLDNNNVINFIDFNAITAAFSSTPGAPNWNPDADLNGNDIINFIDIALFPGFFLMTPGPSCCAP